MNKISKWIKKYADKNGLTSLVVGISGGIDSALVSTLCCETGIDTYVISMPIHQQSEQLERCHNHVSWLKQKYKNVKFIEKNLSILFDNFENLFENDFKTNLSLANSRSRLRMITLYQISGSKKSIVVGTGNKVEDFGIGFFTKYGDGGVDISPIANLTKTQVRELSKSLGINEEIILAKPTDGLWDDDRCDEDQIGASYEELEWAMDYIKNKNELKLSEREYQILDIYKKFNLSNKHKMISIPIYKGKI